MSSFLNAVEWTATGDVTPVVFERAEARKLR